MTKEGDVVLVYMDNQPAFFARIEDIIPDVKPEWFQVKMLVLQVPLVIITWILREPYINGVEFTMGGRPVKIEKVVAPEESPMPEASHEKEETTTNKREEPPEAPSKDTSGAKVISLTDRLKKK